MFGCSLMVGERSLETQMQKRDIKDDGKVRLGGNLPALPVRILPANSADTGKVRLGGNMPALPARIVDNGKVRLGGNCPTL